MSQQVKDHFDQQDEQTPHNNQTLNRNSLWKLP